MPGWHNLHQLLLYLWQRLSVRSLYFPHSLKTVKHKQAMCVYRVRMTQTLNIESQNHDDIIYNFLIGGDGSVYEGRGWNVTGAHLRGFNSDSISFAYIGTFKKQKPSEKQMDATKLLLNEGVRLGELSPDYKIYGAYMLDPTSTDAKADELYNSFKGWPHWSDNKYVEKAR
ncbi:peptidoglycan-recognition protein LC-like [Anastrepha obliqua]|uniref:peptidoglycan-recognition protein LC-like n=1 Tax=Anastrepha obliqua TaxID=95512 RepID=UPI00240A97DE|nr:peptidoglycan-recognition protein LC-like [Anastrepha obliqua]